MAQNITVSQDIDAFMQAGDKDVARATLGVPAAWSTASTTTPAFVFAAQTKIIEWTLTGDSAPTASGYAQGRQITLLITGAGAPAALTLPSWTWVGSAATTLAAGKLMKIDLLCRGTTEASVVASFSVES